jgi:copper chaperone CopZ
MKKVIVIEGMDTLQKGRAVAGVLEGMSGIDGVKLNLDEDSVIVDFRRGAFTEDELCEALSDEGFEVAEIFDA